MPHFSTWLRMTTNWSMSCGWAVAIAERAEGRDALALFFELADRFRRLRPTILSRVELAERHLPSGKRARVSAACISNARKWRAGAADKTPTVKQMFPHLCPPSGHLDRPRYFEQHFRSDT